jgi:hypothetical protein
MARRLLSNERQRVAEPGNSPLNKAEPSETQYDLKDKEVGMVRQKVRKVLPTIGILLYVILSVLFGSLWYAALSLAMTMLER